MVSIADRQKSLYWPTNQSGEPLKVCRCPSSLGPSYKCPRACVFDWWSSGRSRLYEGARLVLSDRSCRCSSHPLRMAGAQRSPRAAWSSRSARICRMGTRTSGPDLQTHATPNQCINNENNSNRNRQQFVWKNVITWALAGLPLASLGLLTPVLSHFSWLTSFSFHSGHNGSFWRFGSAMAVNILATLKAIKNKMVSLGVSKVGCVFLMFRFFWRVCRRVKYGMISL